MFLNPEKSSRFKAIGGTQAIVSILGQQRGESVGHGSHQVTTRVERNFVVFVYTARFDRIVESVQNTHLGNDKEHTIPGSIFRDDWWSTLPIACPRIPDAFGYFTLYGLISCTQPEACAEGLSHEKANCGIASRVSYNEAGRILHFRDDRGTRLLIELDVNRTEDNLTRPYLHDLRLERFNFLGKLEGWSIELLPFLELWYVLSYDSAFECRGSGAGKGKRRPQGSARQKKGKKDSKDVWDEASSHILRIDLAESQLDTRKYFQEYDEANIYTDLSLTNFVTREILQFTSAAAYLVEPGRPVLRFDVMSCRVDDPKRKRHELIGLGLPEVPQEHDSQAATYEHVKHLNEKMEAEEMEQDYPTESSDEEMPKIKKREEKKYNCQECDYAASKPALLIQHLRSHSEQAVCLLEASPVIISEEKVMHQALTGSVENLFYLKEAEHSVNMVETDFEAAELAESSKSKGGRKKVCFEKVEDLYIRRAKKVSSSRAKGQHHHIDSQGEEEMKIGTL
ncbi:hypothetical protein AXG93_3911s1540 [Marchantia polymorpha subsp. ruderalis]|uniref:C2H2-type domain-containing protein n=1 Tax=Marchantia polymorpha subsp. ruderalis TaxID=1480154 RepID=A0A176W4C7_MARPO|nr:hypothetical protein AXG93_3911s1540 [Marchantia polymorpha subsp. ruderalis]